MPTTRIRHPCLLRRSGGALAIGCANRSLILENAVYYVASPEACAAILWKSREETAQATEALRITSSDLVRMGVMDGVIEEPLGGAHRSPMAAFAFIKQGLMDCYSCAALSVRVSPDWAR